MDGLLISKINNIVNIEQEVQAEIPPTQAMGFPCRIR